MRCPALPPDEAERLTALRAYGFADERPLPDLNPVARIAARMFDMPIAAVNMIGHDHVFFAASTGLGDVDMSRDVSFCAHAILGNSAMIVLDATKDERFHDNPLVTGESAIRFYAGIPLRSIDGHALGVLCVIDSKPHPAFSEEDRARLSELARMAEDRLELRRIDVCGGCAAPSRDATDGSTEALPRAGGGRPHRQCGSGAAPCQEPRDRPPDGLHAHPALGGGGAQRLLPRPAPGGGRG